MMTDPIADMLTRIRNGIQSQKSSVTMPLSKLKTHIAEILKQEGFIENFEVTPDEVQGTLTIDLRYVGEEMETPVHGLQKVSKPGCRVYAKYNEIPQVLGGLGIAIVSTNKGLMTGKDAEAAKLGGEVLCSVW